MRSLRLLFSFLLAQGVVAVAAQEFPPLRLGEWREHLPWRQAVSVTQSDSKVYFATEWAVVEIEKSDRMPRFFSKVNGLSDAGVDLVRYHRPSGRLFIVYRNSNLDLLNPRTDEVVNLPFISRNFNIQGDRQIYDVSFDNNFAYLSCGFGLVKFDMDRDLAVYTTFTNRPIYASKIFQGNIYMAAADGMYSIPLSDPLPANFERWSAVSGNGMPDGVSITDMAVAFGKLYFGSGRTLYAFDGAQTQQVYTHPSMDLLYLSAEGAGMMAAFKKGFQGVVQYLRPDGALEEIQDPCGAIGPLDGIEDGDRRFWLADGTEDFRFYDHQTGQCTRFSFNSPHNHKVSEIVLDPKGNTYIATPGPPATLGPPFIQDGVYARRDGIWERWAGATIPAILDDEFSYVDLWRAAAHPTQDRVFFGSWVGGLLEFEEGKYKRRYTKANSILQNAGAAGLNRTAIGGLAFDADNNLWISNYSAASPIAVLKNDGTLRNFSGAPSLNLTQLAIDRQGYKWFVVGLSGGLVVYDSGRNIDDPADDRYRLINSGNSALPTNTVNYVAVDLDGDVWVGTRQGVVTFECGANVFEPSCNGRRRILAVDDFNGYLLETEDVRCIAVDGANRKWFGTTNGVFVLSPDTRIQEANYTTANSPLLDNTINSIAIDPKTGEVWIGTERGVQSLREEATLGGRVNNPGAYAYPNPVRPDYDGPIAIYGLARDAFIKITDIAGNLVHEGRARGGQAVWDGRDYTGRRAASGVYMIFASSVAAFDTPDAIVVKLVLLR